MNPRGSFAAWSTDALAITTLGWRGTHFYVARELNLA